MTLSADLGSTPETARWPGEPNTSHRQRGLPVAVATIVGFGVAIAVLTRRRSPTSQPEQTDKASALAAYLRDHLSGADLAIQIVERLRRSYAGADERSLFDSLYEEFVQDRQDVEALMATLGASSKSAKRVVGQASGSLLKLLAGGERGELALFRTLEALAIGVQGKRCMWRALQSFGPSLSVPSGRTFSELEAIALRQWESIERRRRSLVPATFAIANERVQPGGTEDRM